jgi:hypothetical protein
MTSSSSAFSPYFVETNENSQFNERRLVASNLRRTYTYVRVHLARGRRTTAGEKAASRLRRLFRGAPSLGLGCGADWIVILKVTEEALNGQQGNTRQGA